jgi:DNA ligase-1
MKSSQIMDLIDQIAATSSKNDKQTILTTALQDPDFFKVVNYALNPYLTFGKRPARHSGEAGSEDFTDSTFAILDGLAKRQYTGRIGDECITSLYNRLNAQSAELLWRVINKDLKAGFSESSVNKVYKGAIPETPYMRCSLPKDAKMEEWAWSTGIISQIKADGMFFNGDVESEIVTLTSRQGQPFPVEGFEEVMDQLSWLLRAGIMYLPGHTVGSQVHGELTVVDTNGKTLARQVGNGMINKLIQGTPLQPGHRLVADIWDIIPIECAVSKGKFEAHYIDRLRVINNALKQLVREFNPAVSLIETKIVRSNEEAQAHYKDARKRKLEGTIVKKPTMIWRDGTSKDQVKLKQEVPVELEVEGFEEGKPGSKTEATFGSLRCKTSDGLLKVNVGSGFSDAQRQEINENREDWVGAIITVKSNEIMYAARGKKVHSLFLPIFIERRLDKSTADTFDEVIKQFDNAVEA